MTDTVIVYTKPDCAQCTMTRRLLDHHGIPYTTVDILNPDHLAHVRRLGFSSAPVVEYGATSWAGFRPDLIQTLVESINERENQ